MQLSQYHEIIEWQKATFPQSTAQSKMHHLEEEVAELQTDVWNNDRAGARKELADCLILLAGVADAIGMSYLDVVSAINEKMDINKRRKWGAPDENGVVNHIKE